MGRGRKGKIEYGIDRKERGSEGKGCKGVIVQIKQRGGGGGGERSQGR